MMYKELLEKKGTITLSDICEINRKIIEEYREKIKQKEEAVESVN